MHFHPPLKPAVLIRRYKRFLADVELPDGSEITVHCPNSGSMLGCERPGSPVMLSRSDNPKRKYPHTWEMVRIDSIWVGINTSRTNHLIREALEQGLVAELGVPDRIVAEVRTSPGTRLDFQLFTGGASTYVEVKNCTLVEGDTAMFPDAVTQRGSKHLEELITLRRAGHGAAVLFCVQREDGRSFAPAEEIDPHYAETLGRAREQGVQVLVYQARVGPEGIAVTRPLPLSW